jgi:hypothetical protein
MSGQPLHDRLQGLYQNQTVIDGHDVLAGQPRENPLPGCLALRIPTHRDAGAAAIAELGPGQRRGPLLRFDSRHPGQLLGQHALFQCKLLVMGQMLHAATAATPGMDTRVPTRRSSLALKDTLGAGLNDFAVGAQHPRLNFFTGQRTRDKPGTAFNKGNTAAIIGQALDMRQTLFLPVGTCAALVPPAGWKRRPLSCLAISWARRRCRSTSNGRPGHK